MQGTPLVGCRVLIVEDEYLLADDLRRLLERSGAQVIGPGGIVGDAIRQIREDGSEVAIVDLNLNNEMAYPTADELRQQGVAFVFATGYDQKNIPACFANVEPWEKPLDEQRLVAGLARLCASITGREAATNSPSPPPVPGR